LEQNLLISLARDLLISLNLLISLAGSATLAAAQSYAWLDFHWNPPYSQIEVFYLKMINKSLINETYSLMKHYN
jgi:hypothetical protein